MHGVCQLLRVCVGWSVLWIVCGMSFVVQCELVCYILLLLCVMVPQLSFGDVQCPLLICVGLC